MLSAFIKPHTYIFRHTLRIEIIWLEIQFRKGPHSANSLASFPHTWRLIAEKPELETKKRKPWNYKYIINIIKFYFIFIAISLGYLDADFSVFKQLFKIVIRGLLRAKFISHSFSLPTSAWCQKPPFNSRGGCFWIDYSPQKMKSCRAT